MKTALPSPFAKRLFNEAFSDRSVPRGHPMAHIRQPTAGDGVQSPHKSPRRESPEDLRRLGSGLNQTERRGSAFDRFRGAPDDALEAHARRHVALVARSSEAP